MKPGDIVDVKYAFPLSDRKEVYRTKIREIDNMGIMGVVVEANPPYSEGQGITLPFVEIENITHVLTPIEFEDGDMYESTNSGTVYVRANGNWFSSSDMTDKFIRPYVERGTFVKK